LLITAASACPPQACAGALRSLAALAHLAHADGAVADCCPVAPAAVALSMHRCAERHPGDGAVQAAAHALHAALLGRPAGGDAAAFEARAQAAQRFEQEEARCQVGIREQPLVLCRESLVARSCARPAALLARRAHPSSHPAPLISPCPFAPPPQRLDDDYENALQERRHELAAQRAAGDGSWPQRMSPSGPADHRPSTPDGRDPQDCDGGMCLANERGGGPTRCSSDSGSGSGSGSGGSGSDGQEAGAGAAGAPPAPGAALFSGGSFSSQGHSSEHSLFGSPSLMGDLFGRALPSQSLGPQAAPYAAAPSPARGPGLPPLPHHAAHPDPPALSARLPDALFLHDDASMWAAAGPAPAPYHQQHQQQQREASLFAALQAGAGAPSAGPGPGLFDYLPPGRARAGSGGSSSGDTSSPRSSATGPSRRSGGGSVVHGGGGGGGGLAGWGGDAGAGADALFASLSHLSACHPRAHSHSRGGHLSDGSDGGDAAPPAADAASPDESAEPTRHLWVGNLGTRTSRAALKALFDRFGVVDDLVTFPGRMYAFVNYRAAPEAARASQALADRVVPELTGDRRLLLKYRPVNKAAAHLRAAGAGELSGAALGGGGRGAPGSSPAAPFGLASARSLGDLSDGGLGGGLRGLDLDCDGNCADPSPRIWLGNIAPTASSKVLQAVLSQFGPLTDAAVFPARIGPLGYAFVKFEAVAHAVAAFESLNNKVVPPLSGTKQLKMRYKPAGDGPAGRDECNDAVKGAPAAAAALPCPALCVCLFPTHRAPLCLLPRPRALTPACPLRPAAAASMAPSRHLWLGNVTQKPTDDLILDVFARYGRVDSVRIFPAKAYAFVNFAEAGAAARAMAELDGLPVAPLTGVKPLVMRFQQESHPAVKGGAAPHLPPHLPPLPLPLPRAQSDSALALAASLGALAPGFSGPQGPAALRAALAGGSPGFDARRGPPRRPREGPWAGEPGAGLALHRSHSLGLLGPQQGQGQGQGQGLQAPGQSQAPGQLASLLGMQEQLGGGQLEASGLARAHGAAASLLAHQHQQQQQQHQQQHAPPASASASQLSSVLSNLAALQRAASLSATGPDPAAALFQAQQAAAQAQWLRGPAVAPHHDHDLARLSSMLAGQSLAPLPQGFGPHPATPGQGPGSDPMAPHHHHHHHHHHNPLAGPPPQWWQPTA
jgi:hypothetical protein